MLNSRKCWAKTERAVRRFSDGSFRQRRLPPQSIAAGEGVLLSERRDSLHRDMGKLQLRHKAALAGHPDERTHIGPQVHSGAGVRSAIT